MSQSKVIYVYKHGVFEKDQSISWENFVPTLNNQGLFIAQLGLQMPPHPPVGDSEGTMMVNNMLVTPLIRPAIFWGLGGGIGVCFFGPLDSNDKQPNCPPKWEWEPSENGNGIMEPKYIDYTSQSSFDRVIVSQGFRSLAKQGHCMTPTHPKLLWHYFDKDIWKIPPKFPHLDVPRS